MSDAIKTEIEDQATNPESVSSDAGSVSNRSLDELIDADRYLTSKEAATTKTKRLGFRMGIFRAPGQF